MSALSDSAIGATREFGGGKGFLSIVAILTVPIVPSFYLISVKIESEVEDTRTFVLNEQAASGRSPFKEGQFG